MNARKVLATAATALLTMGGAAAVASVIAYDGFGGGPMATLNGSTGGEGWAGPWLDVGSSVPTYVTATGLEYPDLPTTPGAAVTARGGPNDTAAHYRQLPGYGAPDRDVWVSFLLRPELGHGAYGGLSLGTPAKPVMAGVLAGGSTYGLSVGTKTIASTVPVVVGQPALLVVQVSVDLGATSYTLYVNPKLELGKPIASAGQISILGAGGLPTHIYLANAGGYTTDEIRVATSWLGAIGAPQCRADVDANGAIEPADVAAFLNRWFASVSDGSTVADFDRNGTVDAIDIAAFVTAWAAGLSDPC